MKDFAKKIISIENFFLLVIFCIPLYLVRVEFLKLPSNVLEILAIVAILFLAAKEKSVFFKYAKLLPPTFLLSTLLILAGILISILFNNNYESGFGILKGWFIVPMLFSYALFCKIESENFLTKVFMTFFLSATLVGMISLIYKLLGVLTYDGRLNAFYLSPNHLAMFLAPGIFFGFYLVSESLRKDPLNKLGFGKIAALAVVFISFYFTYSFGAWLAIFASFLYIFLFISPVKNKLLAGFIVALLLLAFLLQTDTQKFSDLTNLSERSSFSSRLMIWRSAAMIIKDNPFVGIGPGNFQEEYIENQKFFPPYLEWAVPQPHNIFLAFWTQTGFLGFLGFLVLMFFVFRALFFSMQNKPLINYSTALLGFFLYTIFHGFVDTPYWKNDLSFIFWICVFLVLFLQIQKIKKFNS